MNAKDVPQIGCWEASIGFVTDLKHKSNNGQVKVTKSGGQIGSAEDCKRLCSWFANNKRWNYDACRSLCNGRPIQTWGVKVCAYPTCDIEFTLKSNRQIYHGTRCKELARLIFNKRRIVIRRRQLVIWLTCKHCEKKFIDNRNGRTRNYCCDEHKNLAQYARRKQERDAKRGGPMPVKIARRSQ